jgi:hypothetical protein
MSFMNQRNKRTHKIDRRSQKLKFKIIIVMVRENINNLHILKEIKCKIEMIK